MSASVARLAFVVPSAYANRRAKYVVVERPESHVTPRHVLPVMAGDRCVCCPSPVKEGYFCSVLYRYHSTGPDGVLRYVRAY